MSHLIRSVGSLKVEIRLQQALDSFIRDLDGDQQSEFREDQASYRRRLPNNNDVMEFMSHLNTKASRSNFGPRAESILRGTQQFAAIGDILIGGSQNLIACGVWTAVRFTLQAAVTSRKLIDKISDIFMIAGRSMPRHEALDRLYDRKSAKLRSYYHEYFLAIVEMCHYLVKFLDKSKVSRAVSSLSDTECNAFQSRLTEWSSQIKDETIFLMAQGIEESRSLLENLKAVSKAEDARRLAKARARILNGCSTYPYETSWKRLRKKGNTRIFEQIPEYASWKTKVADGEHPPTLALTGELGSGKSVLAANIIEDLGSVAQETQAPVLYFFCEYETIKSITPGIIMGSLAKQLLQTIKFTPPSDTSKYTFPLRDTKEVVNLFEDLVPENQNAYCVIDGLYECNGGDLEEVLDGLSSIQFKFKLHICLTFRLEATTKSGLEGSFLENLSIVGLPDNTNDVENFISDELVRCIENDLLKLGDPTLVEEILTTLTSEAKGMFLWAELQISALCWTSSDKEIRQSLKSLPKGLVKTFERLLQKAASHGQAGHDNQAKILSHMMVAARPLTKDELGDLLGITRFDTTWTSDQLCTNVDNMLAACGSLIAVDEDSLSVHFVHSSAKKFLLERGGNDAISVDRANHELGELIVTYLNYNVFHSEVARISGHDASSVFQAGATPTRVIQSSLSAGVRKNMSLKLLQAIKNKGASIDLNQLINREAESTDRNTVRSGINHPFYSYADEYWIFHVAQTTAFSETYTKLVSVIARKHLKEGRRPAWEMKNWTRRVTTEATDILVLLLHSFLDEPTISDIIGPWIMKSFDLPRHYVYDYRNAAAIHPWRRINIDNRLEYFACLAALSGHIPALDFFLYRVFCRSSISQDELAKYAMMAIYRNCDTVLSYLVQGQYRQTLALNVGERAESQPILSESERHMKSLYLWSLFFGSKQNCKFLAATAALPVKWLELMQDHNLRRNAEPSKLSGPGTLINGKVQFYPQNREWRLNVIDAAEKVLALNLVVLEILTKDLMALETALLGDVYV